MPVTFKFITPTGRTFKERPNHDLEKKLGAVFKNSGGKLAQFKAMEIAAEKSVSFGVDELLGVITSACIIFQRLVARTPIDEEYDYINMVKVRRAMKESDGTVQYDWNDFKEHHTPDAERIRDHWNMTIETNGSLAVNLSAKAFNDNLFDEPNDKESIAKIIDAAMSQVKSNVKVMGANKLKLIINYNIEYSNTSKYFHKLEYGRYSKTKDSFVMPHQGEKYLHGISDSGYSIQAPNGFYRKTLLDLNAIIKTASKTRTVSQRLIRNYIEKNPNIRSIERKFSKFEGITDLRNIGADIKFDDMRLDVVFDEVLKCKELRQKALDQLYRVDQKYERDEKHYHEKVMNLYENDTTGSVTVKELREIFSASLNEYNEKVSEIKNVSQLKISRAKQTMHVDDLHNYEKKIKKEEKEKIKQLGAKPTFRKVIQDASKRNGVRTSKAGMAMREYERFFKRGQAIKWELPASKELAKSKVKSVPFFVMGHTGWLYMKAEAKKPIVKRYQKSLTTLVNRINRNVKKKRSKRSK